MDCDEKLAEVNTRCWHRHWHRWPAAPMQGEDDAAMQEDRRAPDFQEDEQ